MGTIRHRHRRHDHGFARSTVVVLSVLLGPGLVTPVARAEIPLAAHQLVADHFNLGEDPVAVRVWGATTYVLDSGWGRSTGQGRLFLERQVSADQPSVVSVVLPDADGLPTAFDIDPATGDAYVVQKFADQLDVISATGKITKTVSLQNVAQYPDAVGIDTGADLLYVGDDNSGNILVFDLETLALIKTIHPPHSDAGITSIAVDAQHHYAWAGSRGGLVFLVGLANNGVTLLGSSYDANHRGNADNWDTSVAIYHGSDGFVGAFWVHANSLSMVTDAESMDRLADPGQQDNQRFLLPKGVVAEGLTVDPQRRCAYVVVPTQQRILTVDVGKIIDYGAFSGLAVGAWTFSSGRRPNAAVARFDGSDRLLVVGDAPRTAQPDSMFGGFLHVEQPTFPVAPAPPAYPHY